MCQVVQGLPRAVKAGVYTSDRDALLFYVYADVKEEMVGKDKIVYHSLDINIGNVHLSIGDSRSLILWRSKDFARCDDCAFFSLDLYTAINPVWNDPNIKWHKKYRDVKVDFLSNAQVAITTNKSSKIHTLAVLCKPYHQWSRPRSDLDNTRRCYHVSEILPIYCINCQEGIVIPDTMIQDNIKDILEYFRTLYTEDQEHLKQLATVLADLSLADTLGVAYTKGTGSASDHYIKALDTFKQQVLERYQIAAGHQLPAEVLRLVFVPRLQTYDIESEQFIESRRIVFRE